MRDLSFAYFFAVLVGILGGWRLYRLLIVFIFRIMKRTAPLFSRREGIIYATVLLLAAAAAASALAFLPMSPVLRLSVCFVASIFAGFASHMLRVCLRPAVSR